MTRQSVSKRGMGLEESPGGSAASVCPVCQSGQAAFLCNVDNYGIWRCPQCYTDFVNPMPGSAFLKSLYDNEEWFEGGKKGGYKNYDQQTAQVLPVFEDVLAHYEKMLSGRDILDVGCGYGTHLAIAAARGWKCFGVEVSKHARELAGKRHPRLYLTDRVEHLIPHRFDLILMLDVIEHLTDPYKLFYELFSKGAITRETRIVITTPNAGCREAVSNPAGWAYRHPPSHLIYYSAHSFKTLLERLHFRDVNIRGIHPLPEGESVNYSGENSSVNDKLIGYGGLLCEGSGSDFAEFMHERYVPGTWSKITEYEHLPRYIFAKQFAQGAKILDFGCGTGYGTALLAESAQSVMGVDIDSEALNWARQTHRRPNLKFEHNSDLAAGLESASFDLITCFELIEHVDQKAQHFLIDSFARLLSPRGRLLISTPNPQVTVNYGNNPYHLREMNESEFYELVRSRFRHVRMLNQLIRPSVSIIEGPGPHQRADFYNSAQDSMGVPSNYIAICSHEPIELSPAFCYFDTSSDYIGERFALENRLNESQSELLGVLENTARQESEVQRLNAEIRKLTDEIQTKDLEIANLASDSRNLHATVTQLTTYSTNLRHEIEAFKAAKIFRLREALKHPFSLRNSVRITYLLMAMATPQRLRMHFRPLARAVKARVLARGVNPASSDAGIPLKSQTAHAPVRRVRKPRITSGIRLGSRRAQMALKTDHVSVVIPTKNAGPRFGEVLKALKAQEFHGVIDITIVDSGSEDRTTELAEQYGARVIRINPGTFDRGLTRNLAIEHVSGDVVVLLTQHAVPGTCRMVSELVKALEDSAVAGAYGLRIPHSDTEVFTRKEMQETLSGGAEPSGVFVDSYETLTPSQRYVLCNFDHSCAVVRKSVWHEFPFRQNNFAEDLEWGKRVLEAGWKIAYEPAAFVIDSHHRSFIEEYKRIYLYHRKLYGLFGLVTFPTLLDALNSVPRATLRNWSYVWRTEPALRRRLALLSKVPFLTVLTTCAQYRGACDEREKRLRQDARF